MLRVLRPRSDRRRDRQGRKPEKVKFGDGRGAGRAEARGPGQGARVVQHFNAAEFNPDHIKVIARSDKAKPMAVNMYSAFWTLWCA